MASHWRGLGEGAGDGVALPRPLREGAGGGGRATASTCPPESGSHEDHKGAHEVPLRSPDPSDALPSRSLAGAERGDGARTRVAPCAILRGTQREPPQEAPDADCCLLSRDGRNYLRALPRSGYPSSALVYANAQREDMTPGQKIG